MMKLRKILPLFGLTVGILTAPLTSAVQAHVVVRPAEVLTAAFQTFTVSVPNERDEATIGVKVIIPGNLKHVFPSVKPGWDIAVKKQGQGEAASVTSINWTGNLPVGFRDDFTFSAQAPAEPTELQWKAYQTYADGKTVAWDLAKDKQPKKADGSPDFSDAGPFSVSAVVNEIRAQSAAQGDQNTLRPMLIASAALVVSLFAVFLASRKNSSKK